MVGRYCLDDHMVSICFDCLVVKVLMAFSMRGALGMGGMERIGHFRGRIAIESVRQVADFMV